jgi:type IV secretory pathway TraG/TraD family ATPase VirD4
VSIAQVRSSYGTEEAATIVENCGNTLILRCSASEGGGTARFASQLIGEREIIRTQVSKSLRPNDWFSTKTISEHHVTEHAVMPSEIEQLPDLAGFLKLPSSPSWRRVNIVQP